jgi:putative membrane protein
MHWLARLAIIVGGNALSLWVADKIVPGFSLNGNWITIILVAVILALLTFFLKPVLTLIFGPIIVITLGIGLIIVNVIILYVLQFITNNIDITRGSIIIQSIPALLLATLVVSAINYIIHLAL